ncbi:glycosyl hydrolase family 61-domain-containing protein [Achaetomium macrosporum]|uniref:lytic cellulose monooxygenase (C4-dehydrogenating) n=1 Tax=Achaetomium macrosporum TaxID=79813 RepID=A0AAN7C9B7_9PEZI|nr:glycosyl hydrolase family 61-domain-containing protein [Achaetomium macrosporum]
MYFTTTTMLALASTVSAHTLMWSAWVNGVDQGDGRNVYIRSPPNNSPVKDLASPDLVCNVNGGKAAPSFIQAAAGDKLTFEWYHNTRGDDIVDLSHKGPIITYIAPYTDSNGASPIWSKIAEDGFANGKWAVETLVANKGKYDFTLPAALAPGKYLVRQEIIALHEADAAYNVNPARGAQFYPSCVQVEVTSGGSAVPNENFDFNTGYTYSDRGIVFNLYGSFSSYPIPGPAIWNAASSGGSSGGASSSAAPAPTSAPSSSAAPTTTAVTVVPTTTAAPTTLVTSVRTSAAPSATTSTSAKPVPTRCASRRKNKRNMRKNKAVLNSAVGV